MYIAPESSLETGKSQEYYPVGRSTSVSFSDSVRCMREGNLRVYHPDDLLPTRGNMYFWKSTVDGSEILDQLIW